MRSINATHAERIARAFQAKILNYQFSPQRVVFGLELKPDHTKDDLVNAGVELVNILGYVTGRDFGWNMEIDPSNSNIFFFPDWQVE